MNYPGTYPDNYEEQFSISVEDGSRISILFEHMNLEDHVSCIYDYIEGDTIDSSKNKPKMAYSRDLPKMARYISVALWIKIAVILNCR